VNNAGIGGSSEYRKTAQGFERIFATNHLGHFLLTMPTHRPVAAERSRVPEPVSDVRT
jgi:NAD(P)-dependent dehydrogenase (short-subunit alcohol dehydrogenase family)